MTTHGEDESMATSYQLRKEALQKAILQRLWGDHAPGEDTHQLLALEFNTIVSTAEIPSYAAVELLPVTGTKHFWTWHSLEEEKL